MAETERNLPINFLPGQSKELSTTSSLSPSSVDDIKEPLSKKIKIDDGLEQSSSILSNQTSSLLSSSGSADAGGTPATCSTVNMIEENKLEFEISLNLDGAQVNESSNCENLVPSTLKNENQSEFHDFKTSGVRDVSADATTEDSDNVKLENDEESSKECDVSTKSLKVDELLLPKEKLDELLRQGEKLGDADNSTKKRKKKVLTKKVKGKSKDKKEDEEDGDGEPKKKKRKKKSPKVPKESENTNKEGKSNTTSTKKSKAAHLRKNIRDILTVNQLEEETLAAQREEAERRKRMNLKLQQQQQQQQQQQLNLAQVLTMAPPMKEEIDQLCDENGITAVDFLSSLAGEISSQQRQQPQEEEEEEDQQQVASRVPCVIDEVTLSSDEEEPKANLELNKLKNSLTDFLPLQEKNGLFRSSGGIVTKHETGCESEENVISLTSPDGEEHRDSDSDDCVVISPPSFHDEIEKEGREDENNVPDELGRVLINVGHPPEDEDIFLAPQIAKAVKPHQIGGIRFLYDNLVESLDRFDTSNGFGCILAHSMGLGKTIQAVSFCDIFLRSTRATKVLIIVPINTIQNWVNEFNYWIPPEESLHEQSATNLTFPNSLSTTKLSAAADKKLTKRKSKLDQDPVKLSNNNNNEESPQEQTSSHLSNSNVGGSPTSPFLQQQPITAESQVSPKQEEEDQVQTEQPMITSTSDASTSQVNTPDENSTIGMDNSSSGSSSSNHNNSEEKRSTTAGDVRPRNFRLFLLNETVKTLTAREKIIEEWSSKGGVLLLGYEMYRMLALKRLKRSSKKKAAMDDLAMKNQMLEQMSLNRIYSYIVNPGPDLVVCDEGHRIKNSGASISQALKAIRTKRRVVLTGYPLQNNLMEYWTMVDWIRPNYLGSKVEFSNMFERPITNGQCVDSSGADKKLMRHRSHVLHTLLEGFVQRRSHLVLQSALPFKEEWVFFLKMTSIQYALYKEFIRYLKEERQEKERERNSSSDTPPSTNPIKAFAVCCKIWNHPDALYNVVKKKEDVLDDLDLDDIATDDQPQKVRAGRKPKSNNNGKDNALKANLASAPSPTNFTDFSNFNSDLLGLSVAPMSNIPATVGQVQQRPQNNQSQNQSSQSTPASDGRSISLDWAIPIFKNYTHSNLENGVKFQLLFIIIEEVMQVGDKLLVFSQSLLTLDLIELFLGQKFNWKKNKEYFRLDGSTSGLDREKLINDFNEKEGLHVFLVSTRAGSLGINLIGANRVVVFDASWNPCHDAQAVCRVYRYGQKKECQIYRFVTDCSLEKRIYDRQINKRGMADRVVDEMNPETLLNSRDVSSFLVLDHEQMDALQAVKHNFNMDKFTDPVLRNVLDRCGDRFTREPFEHESLLIDRKETKLSANEKRQARRNYEMEKNQGGSNSGSGYSYNRPSYAAYYPQQQEQSSMGVPIHPSFSSGGSVGSISSYGHSNYNNHGSPSSYIMDHSKQIAGRPFPEQMMKLRQIQQQRLQMQHQEHYQSQRQKNLNFPFQALKDRGIDVQSMLVKKDAYLKDPTGGSGEIYLRAGEKIHIFRSKQGIYFRVPSGRIISIKQINSNLLPKGLSLSDNLTEEQIQSIVFSLLRPAGKVQPPYFNSCLNTNNGSKSEIPPFFGSAGNTSSLNSVNLFKTNRPPPSLQKLPPTLGILPNYQNHQITNFRSNSGGDVTVWRKHSDSNNIKDRVKMNVSPTTPPTSTNYHHPIMPKSSLHSASMNNNTSSGGSSNSKKDGDVEVIEFNTHFGEILKNPRLNDMKNLKISSSSASSTLNALLNQNTTNNGGEHSRRRKDQLGNKSRSTYSDSPLNILQDNSNSSTELQTRNRNSSIDAPDMSITTIAAAAAPGGQQNSNNNSFPLLNLGNLLSSGNENSIRNSSRGSSRPLPFASKSLSTVGGGSSESLRNMSSSNLSWDQNSGCGSASNSGSDQNSNNSNNNDDNLDALFWSLTGEPGPSSSTSSKIPTAGGGVSSSRTIGITPNATSNSLTSEMDGLMDDDEDMVSSSSSPWSTMTQSGLSPHNPHHSNYRHAHNNDDFVPNSRRNQTMDLQQGIGGVGPGRYDFDPDIMVQNMLRGFSNSGVVGAGTSPRGTNNTSGLGILSGFNGPGSLTNQCLNSGGGTGGIHSKSSGNFPFPLSNSSETDLFGNVYGETPPVASVPPPPPDSSGGIMGNYDDFLGAAGSNSNRIGGVFGGIARTAAASQRPINISHQQHLQNMLNPGQYYNNNSNQPGDNNIGHGTNRFNSHNFPTTNLFNFNVNNN